VRKGAWIWHPWLLQIGDWTTLADDVVIYNLGPVHIGSHTVLSQGVYVCAGTHDYLQPTLPLIKPPIRIGSGVWIAAQAFIGPGVTINDKQRHRRPRRGRKGRAERRSRRRQPGTRS